MALISAPMFQVGSITVEQPWMKTIRPSSSIFSYVMNNYWHTNYKADQEGPVAFSYQLVPHGQFDALEAVRCGLASRTPLMVLRAESSKTDWSLPFDVRTNAVLLSVVPLERGEAFLLFVYNPSSATQSVSCHSPKKKPVMISESNPAGKMLSNTLMSVDVAPYGTKYLLVRSTVFHDRP
jgi:alpha-mannosidase